MPETKETDYAALFQHIGMDKFQDPQQRIRSKLAMIFAFQLLEIIAETKFASFERDEQLSLLWGPIEQFLEDLEALQKSE